METILDVLSILWMLLYPQGRFPKNNTRRLAPT